MRSILFSLLMVVGVVRCYGQPGQMGPGNTTYSCIDWDGDGYGRGACPNGVDADDNDASVTTSATLLAKYGTVAGFLTHFGFSPTHVIYVSTSGNDSSCATVTTPFAPDTSCLTPIKALSLMSSGDVMLIRAGTYTMSGVMYGVPGGTSSQQTGILAYPGEFVALNYASCGGTCYAGFSANDTSYWTLRGIAVENAGGNGYGVDEQGFANPTNVQFIDNYFAGWYDQLFIQGGSTNLYIYKNVFTALLPGGEHNLYLGANPNISTGLVITGNLISEAGTGGGHNIHLNGRFSGALISQNVLYATESQNLGLQEGVNHSTFENNVIFTSLHGAFFFLDYADRSDQYNIAFDQNYNVIRNNSFVMDGGDYQNSTSSCSLPLARFTDVSGSTCVQNGGACSVVGTTFTCTGGTQAGCSNCCSFSNGLGGPNVSHDLGHQTIDNNVFYTNCAGGAGLAPCAIDLDTDINGAGGVGWLSTSTWRNNLLYSPNSYGINYMTNETYSQANTGCCGLGTNASYATFVSNVGTASGNSQANPTLTALNYNWYSLASKF